MNRYAVLLRGINIGSRKLQMADLRRLAEDLGYTGASNDLHWIVRKGNTLEGFGSAVLGSRRYQAILTSRNLNTVEKIARGLEAL